MKKKHLEPVANSDTHDLDEIFGKLREEFGAEPEIFEYLADTIRAQHERIGDTKLGFGLGLDRNAEMDNAETNQKVYGELLVLHMDVARASNPSESVNRVVIGFMLKDGKIDQIVKMS